MTPAARAWLFLAAGILGYDLAAADGETLSEGADRWMLVHPWRVRLIAFALAAHVCNLVPPRWDAVHLIFAGARRMLRGFATPT